MQEASGRLTGRHDFTTFRSVQCQAASPERSLDRLDVVAEDGEIRIRAVAEFSVQSGTLHGRFFEACGEGKWSANLSAALEAKDRVFVRPLPGAWFVFYVCGYENNRTEF